MDIIKSIPSSFNFLVSIFITDMLFLISKLGNSFFIFTPNNFDVPTPVGHAITTDKFSFFKFSSMQLQYALLYMLPQILVFYLF